MAQLVLRRSASCVDGREAAIHPLGLLARSLHASPRTPPPSVLPQLARLWPRPHPARLFTSRSAAAAGAEQVGIYVFIGPRPVWCRRRVGGPARRLDT